jgi:PhnB protein
MSTTEVQPYLFFNGRCDEALEFYQKALGAQVDFLMRYRENPDAFPPGVLPPGFENKVMHATFRIGETTLMASDGREVGPKFGGFSLSLTVPTVAVAKRVYAALASGGQPYMPLTKTFWSPCFGMLTDQFGMGWMISIPGPNAQPGA